MKELEKTKRISISMVAFILIIVIGFLTFRKPTKVYGKSISQTHEVLKSQDYLMTIEKSLHNNNVLIDVRNRFEYGKAHLDNAINIPSPEILEDQNLELFKTYQENNTPVIIYGTDPVAANSAWMLLYQMGFDNIKLLNASTSLLDNKLKVIPYALDKPIDNYSDIFKVEVPKKAVVIRRVVKKKPIKIIPKKKKKKKRPEGGC